MSGTMTYKGYDGSVCFSEPDRVFHGKIEFVRDLVTYEGTDVDSLEQAFHEAVDDYLQLCQSEGRPPDQPFKGTFNVRTGSDLHRRTSLYARENGTTLNGVVVEALRRYLAV